MDKFDDFLEKKSKSEDKDFILPKSFEDKLQNTLDNLENEPEKSSYRNKKVIACAAGIAFVCLIGWQLSSNKMLGNNMNSRMLENSISNETADYDSGSAKSYMSEKSDDYGTEESSIDEKIIDENNISKVIFKDLNEKPQYKVVNKSTDINQLVNLINNNCLVEINEIELDNWQYLIETVGEKNHIIMIKDNIMNIDDRWFEINANVVEEFESLYDKFEYTEKDMNSCDF